MKKFSLEEVKVATLKYFRGDDLAADVWISKYCLKDSEGNLYELSPDDMHCRLAKEFARIEQKYPNPLSENEIYELLKDFKYIVPQGSPMEGIGNNLKVQSLSNCYVIGNSEDSYGSVMKIDEESVHIMRRRGGVGSDMSGIRPRGAYTTCAANTSTGVIPFAERYSNSTREVAQDGRRGARMISLDGRHPDSEEFIDAKLDSGKITGANISIKICNEFMESIESDADFIQTFPIDLKLNSELIDSSVDKDVLIKYSKNEYFKIKSAKKLWDKIIKNAHKSAEPGILFIDKIQEESPSDCYGTDWKSDSSNPCGEIPMNPYSSCILTAINLYSYVINPFTLKSKFNWKLFESHSNLAQKLLDDIVDLEVEKIDIILNKINNDPESNSTKFREIELWGKIKNRISEGRRTGLGITAEGDMLAALGFRYGTKEATEFSKEVHKQLAINSYKSSIEMAKERGAFPIWNYGKERKNPFIKRFLEELNSPVENNSETFSNYYDTGRRNIANLTIAPTGTTSLMTQTTSGIEPVFLPVYKRRRKTDDIKKSVFKDESGDMWEEYIVFHHKFIEWYSIVSNLKNYKKAKFALENTDQTMLDKLVKESPYYKATSADVDWRESVRMQGEIQKWVDHSISKTINLPENTSVETVDELYRLAHKVGCKGVTVYREGSRSGVLLSNDKKEEKEGEIIYRSAPKRPKEMACDIYTKTALGKEWTFLVGLLKNKPYEIFAFEQLNQCDFPKEIKNGICVRVTKQHYRLIGQRNNKEYIIDNIVNLMSLEEQYQTKDFSRSLRHGEHPRFIVNDIEKSSFISSFRKVSGRVLSNYLTEKDRNEKCPDCGDKLTFSEGCVSCPSCPYSKCG